MGNKKERLVRFLINRRIKHNSKQLAKKITETAKDIISEPDAEIVALHKKKWERIFTEPINTGWLKWYIGVSGIESENFIPENVFYGIVEPIINNSRFTVSYSDKNFYDLVYPKGIFPECIIRNIDSFYYDSDYKPLDIKDDNTLLKALSGNDRVFVKPATEAGGGREVDQFSLKDGKLVNRSGLELTLKLLERVYKQSFIIQKPLTQHAFAAYFNSTSLNTIRVLTYRSPVTNSINILQSVFRVGAKDQFLDNSRAGGYSIGMNSKGKLNKFALKKDGSKFEKVNDISLADNDFTIPFFDQVIATARLIAEKNIHHRMLALDMTIDEENNIRCIEINNRSNEINFHQLNNGPLFGEFTDEVIAYCEKHTENLYKEIVITTIPFVP